MTRIVVIFAFMLLTAVAMLRPPEYDEAYSIFLTAGDPRPVWPVGIFTPADVMNRFTGHASFAQIARDLRTGDVHPPLYFWVLEVWRLVFGPSWFAARMLSVVISTASLAILARRAAVPVVAITLLSYGFAYTGSVARGFALAEFFTLLGFTLAYPKPRGLAAGLAFGAAGFCNYLAVFPGLAVLAWLGWRDRKACAASSLGLALFLPAELWFFLAQKGSRTAQFVAFSPIHAVGLLAKDFGAAMFGGLPVYAGRLGPVVGLTLAGLFLLCLAYAARRRGPEFFLCGLCAAAMPVGLLGLGLVFNNTPIEIRYLAFCCPFVGLLFGTLPRPLLAVLLIVQAAGIAGLLFAPATMQPQGLAARPAAGIHALVLVPFGNDGVGVPGPFIAAAAPNMRILLLRPGGITDISAEPEVVLAMINVDDASTAEVRAAQNWFATHPCWVPAGGTKLTVLFANRCAHQQS
jgi:hypothetical protein